MTPAAQAATHRWLGLLLGAGFLCVACSPQAAEDAPDARPPPVSEPSATGPALEAPETAEAPAFRALEPGSAIERSVTASEVHRYQLLVAEPATVELAAEQRGIDLELAVFAPGGEPLLVADRVAGPGGEERPSWVAATPGRYVLEVRTWHGPTAAGAYRLRVGALRETTPADRRRAAVDRPFAEAEALVARQDEESFRRAEILYGRALERVRALPTPGDRRQQAQILQRLGRLHRKYLEDKHAALGDYTDALALFETLGDDRQAASILNNLGRVHFDLGELPAAIDAWNRALPIKRRLHDPAGEAYSLGNLALAHRYLGNIQEALDAYDRSLELLRAAGDRGAEGRALNNRGRFYRLLGEDEQALADLRRALPISREVGDGRLEAAVLTAIGEVETSRGDLEPAREVLERALELRIELDQRRGRAVTERALGTLYARLGRVGEAAELDRRALAGFRETGATREAADALLALGELALDAGRPDEAHALLDQALDPFRAIHDPFGTVETMLALARCRREEGDLEDALDLAEAAADEIEAVRARLGSHSLRTSFLATRQEPYDLAVDLLMDLHRRDPAAGHDREALAVSERARARSLIDLLAESGVPSNAGADPELVAEEHELELRLAALEQERLGLASGAAPERVAVIEGKLDELVRSYRAVRGRIHAESPRRAALAEPPTLTASEIQRRLLDPETALLEIHLGARRSVLWLVTTSSVTSFELPARPVIEAAARRAYGLLRVSHLREAREASTLALGELSDLVLGPVADRLQAEQTGRLLVSPDGALRLIPFAALPMPGAPARDRTPLVSGHEIVTLPSASVLGALRDQTVGREPPAGTVAVLADPVFEATDTRLGGSAQRAPGPDGVGVAAVEAARDDRGPAVTRGGPRGEIALRRLPFSSDEAAAILRLAEPGKSYRALGFEATREVAMSPALGGYRIVHLATHGALDSDHPELSRLVFSRFDAAGRSRRGALFAHEIYDLELPVDLVVLSACETALGKEMRGEGLVGLTQGFFHAGAARVLVSLWQVDDRATAELMARFYEGLLVEHLAPPAALRQAQLAIRSEAGWQAPYYWAGFVLQGEWR